LFHHEGHEEHEGVEDEALDLILKFGDIEIHQKFCFPPFPFFVSFVLFVVNSLRPPVLLRNRRPFRANIREAITLFLAPLRSYGSADLFDCSNPSISIESYSGQEVLQMVVETEREDDGRWIAEISSRLGWLDFALQAVVQTSSPCGLRSKTGDRTEAFTAENAEHAERGSRIE
jgi:hypothetical protein